MITNKKRRAVYLKAKDVYNVLPNKSRFNNNVVKNNK